MASRGEGDNFSTRAERAPADVPSPDLDATGPLADPLADAFAVEPPPATRPRPEEPLGPNDEPVYARPRRPPPQSPRNRPRRVAVRRVRRTIRHVDPLSVLKVSLMFYGVFLILWLVLVAILYWIIDAAGFFDTVQEVAQAFVLDGEWKVSLGFVEKWAFFIGLGAAIVMSLLNLFLAFLYNVVADIIGGIDITFVERDS